MIGDLLTTAYDCAMAPASLAVAPLFYFHSRGRERLGERFGGWELPPGEYLWFHGASAGEVRGLLPIIRELRALQPSLRTLLTVTSVTGIPNHPTEVDQVRVLPFDSSPWIRRAIGGIHLKGMVSTETELWPVLFRELSRREVPTVLVNARVSQRTFPRYRRGRSLLTSLLSRPRLICTSDPASVERFIALGAPPDRVRCVGNAKYDTPEPPGELSTSLRALRAQLWRDDAAVLVLGSIRPGEESWWFTEFAKHGSQLPFRVIVAPRHREKFEYFANALRRHKITFSRWSEQQSELAPVLLLDTFGELQRMYGIAQIAFIGATLVDIGGHNPLEAAIHGVSVATGPYTHVIDDVVADLVAQDAHWMIRSPDDVTRLLSALVHDPHRVRRMGDAARSVWRMHSGASARIVELIAPHLFS
jgi:3-deoxy-D-manno-octulosonic-acid transferase